MSRIHAPIRYTQSIHRGSISSKETRYEHEIKITNNEGRFNCVQGRSFKCAPQSNIAMRVVKKTNFTSERITRARTASTCDSLLCRETA